MAETSISGLRQFMILLYKGLLLRKRHYIVTFFELVIPVLIASVPAIIMSESAGPNDNDITENRRSDLWVNYTTYEPFDPFQLPKYYSDSVEFVYAPSNPFTEKFVNDSLEKYRNESGFSWTITTTSFKTEEELEVYCTNKQRSGYYINIIGTVFNSFEDGSLPKSLDYKIRYGQRRYFYTQIKYRVNGPQYSNSYTESLFLGWQSAIEETFIQRKMEETKVDFDYRISMQRFPYPDHLNTNNYLSIISIVPWCFCSGLLIFIINIVRRIIEEKANGSKELLKMMGMSDYVYWMATFTNSFIVAFYLSLVISIIYKAPLKYSYVFLKNMDFMLLFILLLVFLSSMILFCMAFSVFFTRAIYAVIVLMIVYYVSFSSFFTTFFIMNTELNYMPLPLMQKLGICLLPTGSILTMFTLVSFYENSGEGAHWSNLTEFSIIPDLNMLMILLSMLFSCALYIFIIWYFDKVWPWQPGVPQPFYFPFTRSYWCGPKGCGKTDEIPLVNSISDASTDFFEVEPSSAPGVVIKNLSKEFRSGLQTKLAVNDVSLNIFKGQITALLGHNGAGKTTTINILTGLYSPSKGTASINGLDILKETHRARRGLGVCPQHNVLYDTLTVEEHLKIYAAMKGVAWGNLTSEATSVLEILKLTNKRYELTKTLSGGMKRKLSLAIAIVGGSKVLFLDEPTSGLDVEARRSVWDALLNIRHDRTIVLTTHYMEEADILGDRIAIMAEGEVQCCGSPIFLKQKFGTGYHLHIVKDTNFDRNQITSLLEKYNPGVTLGNELDKEITFKLSSDSSDGFGEMFEQLENFKQKLGVVSFGITVTTMEDVFLKVANISDMKYKLQDGKTPNGAATEFEDVYGPSSHTKLKPTLANQLLGLLLKRLHYSKRHWGILIVQFIIPFLLLCVLLFTIRSISDMNKQTYDPLKLDLNQVYGHTEAFYYQRNEQYQPISDLVLDIFDTNKAVVKSVTDPTRYVLQYGKDSISKYFKTLMVGGGIDKFDNGTWNLTAWYNGEPYHTAPMSLLMMHDAVLKKVADGSSISLTNSPLPETRSGGRMDQLFMTERLMSGTIMPLILGFIIAGYTLVPTHERTTKAKLLQIMSGVHPVMYWGAMFMWDFMVYSAICVLMIIPYAIFSHYAFFGLHSDAIGTALLLMLFYGWASIPFSYLMSFIFKKGNTGFSVIVGFCSIFGVALGTTLRFFQYILFTMDNKSIKVMDGFVWFLRLFPTFCSSVAFQNLFGLAFYNSLCESVSPDVLRINCESPSLDKSSPLFQCCKGHCGNSCLTEKGLLTWDQGSCGRDIFFLFLDGAIHFCFLILLETTYMASLKRVIVREFGRLRRRPPMQVLQDAAAEDSEVMAEEQKIRHLLTTRQDAGDEALAVVDLAKSYKNFYAVDHLAFGIHKEECFGLLGVNGAGKTTTFRMLTGDCHPSDGNAIIQNVSVRTDLKKFQSFLGYCPQFDALIDRLTGREMLQLFARLRGLSGPELDERVDKMIKMTDLTAYADKQSQFYSGGNKRKLSVGIALIGSPPLLLLDEPTAGVDPVSRRKIWNILSQARNNTGASVILTTHSMEESEALCSRLAIMVNGRFRCLGSIQQLKSKYGQGYTLIIKMKRELQGDAHAMSNIKAHVEGNMQGAQLKDDHQGMLQYHIIDPSVTLSTLFKFMSHMKTQFDLEDYLISDTSLEQIFLTFARAQRLQA